ncbi:MAG: spermidine/putrescine ABC transporter ATP-binding protein PotA [Deltaproteobacteria bacterium]|nr:spermidine/putrescine ABC transporter ATP-binding protein PotA [Deltaproteobacteria bacterium]
MKNNGPILELRGVSKYYGSTAALHDINLEVENGEFLTLLGPSGCGKTTILRLFSGFESPSKGDVLLNGKVINDIVPEKRQLNTVFQNYALFPHMSVQDNVSFGLRMQKRPKAEINSRVQEVLRMVHLEDFATRMPAQLSGGQQQRVAIARAVVMNPMVLLLDEPFSALDFKLRKQMQFEIKHLQRQLGITFIFVTHDQEEAFAMSDRVVVMNQGYIEQSGSPQEIYEEPENLFVARFVGEINILEATILEVQEMGQYLADIDGVTFPLRTRREFAVGEKVLLLLRPEDLKVYRPHDEDLEGPHLYGRINETVYKGATVDLTITLTSGKKIQAAEFFNEDDADINYNRGERVAVNWVAGWEVVLDDAGE